MNSRKSKQKLWITLYVQEHSILLESNRLITWKPLFQYQFTSKKVVDLRGQGADHEAQALLLITSNDIGVVEDTFQL